MIEVLIVEDREITLRIKNGIHTMSRILIQEKRKEEYNVDNNSYYI